MPYEAGHIPRVGNSHTVVLHEELWPVREKIIPGLHYNIGNCDLQSMMKLMRQNVFPYEHSHITVLPKSRQKLELN